MTRFASPETYSKYLATPIEAFMPDSTEWDNFGLRFLQQGALNDVNAEYAALIGAQGDAAAKQMRTGFETAAGRIRDQANSNLTNSLINLGVGVGMGGLKAGWFNNKPTTLGLGDGFNIGKGQAGLDPTVDLDSWLQTGGTINV